MAATDLRFKSSLLANPADLVFGGEDTVIPNREVTLNANFALGFRGKIGPRVEVELAASFPFAFACEANYNANVARPLVGEGHTTFQPAQPTPSGCEIAYQDGAALIVGTRPEHQSAEATPNGALIPFQQADPLHGALTNSRHQDAIRVPAWLVHSRHQDALRDRRTSSRSRYQTADKRRHSITSRYQDFYHDRRSSLRSEWQNGAPVRKSHSEGSATALPHWINLGSKFQDAMVPPPGVTLPPEPPEEPPCYEPDPNLLFSADVATNANLLFVCELDSGPPGNVVVPVKRVYVVINTVSLRRVANDLELPALSMSLTIDVDSWTWGFSASLPGAELNNVLPDSNGPIELEANINGTLYRVLAERVSRERSFASNTIKVSGRGKSALLASPYSVLRTFTNDTARTAQQLMADVLEFNNVPIGWDIDWQLDDWLVPAGAFSMNGAYIDGLNAIAGAAGAYLQPHPVNQELSVLHRYPFAPWDWGTVTPDFDLPAAVTLQEGIEWDEKPEYNRVYASGTSQGILARVTRTGTDGSLLAPMVTDPLITAVNAGRQRGRAVLSDTGRQARVSLKLPVLPETGVITPGKFVRYNDGSVERLGLVRSTSVDAGWPEVWQSITVETHV